MKCSIMQRFISLLCLLTVKEPSRTEIRHNFENSTCEPLKWTMGSSILIVYQYVWEYPPEYKGLLAISKDLHRRTTKNKGSLVFHFEILHTISNVTTT